MKQSVVMDKKQSKNIRIGIWSSVISAIMLIGIGIFWVVYPSATEGSFSIAPDSPTAITFSKIIAIFKAVGDILPPVFILLAIKFRQYRLAGYFHLVTFVLIILVDMLVWGSFVPNASAKDVLMHVPFAIPMLIAAYNFLKPVSKNL
ncbi:MAG: hypothetical protein K9J12_18240 [Melioribacteraceae bacterium]|nr:hypothetical protein [Melioribacteraceae bacterium]MCF8263374.1 hypothetical protein [Melioribacteraceae bacterium]MCF8430860.1 hypothetical protein [Melioribacteraceae bacterium]